MEGILSGKKAGLIAEATRRMVSSDGMMADIRRRIVANMVSKFENVPAKWAPLLAGAPTSVDEEAAEDAADATATADADADADADAADADMEAQIRAAAAQVAAKKEQEEFLLLEQIAAHEAQLEQQQRARAKEARTAALHARLAELRAQLDAPVPPPQAKVTEAERLAQEHAAKVQELQASLDAAVAAASKAKDKSKSKSKFKSGPRIAEGKSDRASRKQRGSDDDDSDDGNDDDDDDDDDDDSSNDDSDDESVTSTFSSVSRRGKAAVKFAERAKHKAATKSAEDSGQLLTVARIGANLHTTEGVRFLAPDGSVLTIRIVKGGTPRKHPELEVNLVERSTGEVCGTGQQRKDHAFKQGPLVRSLPQFEVWVTELIEALTAQGGDVPRTDPRALLKWADAARQRQKDLQAVMKWAGLVRPRFRVVAGPGHQKKSGRPFQYSDTAEIGAGVLYMYNVAACAGDMGLLPGLVTATWPIIARRLSAQNGGMYYEATWAQVAQFHGLQCPVHKCGEPGGCLEFCRTCEDNERKPPSGRGAAAHSDGGGAGKEIDDPAFTAWCLTDAGKACARGTAVKTYKTATGKDVVRKPAAKPGGGGGGGGGGKSKGPMDLAAFHAFLASAQGQISPAPSMGTAVGAGP